MKYAVKAMTDADGDTEVYWSHGRVLRPSTAKKRHGGRAIELLAPPPNLMQFLLSDRPLSPLPRSGSSVFAANRSLIDAALSPLMQISMGSLEKVKRSKRQRCMFWVNPSYQTCMDFPEKGSHEFNIILDGRGQVYRQRNHNHRVRTSLAEQRS